MKALPICMFWQKWIGFIFETILLTVVRSNSCSFYWNRPNMTSLSAPVSLPGGRRNAFVRTCGIDGGKECKVWWRYLRSEAIGEHKWLHMNFMKVNNKTLRLHHQQWPTIDMTSFRVNCAIWCVTEGIVFFFILPYSLDLMGMRPYSP